MRIIAGQRRGHKIDGPTGKGTRPTSDLVREALFNILGELVADRLVVDLFAGTGALGLEALSRGARRAVFVEKNRANVALIKRNIITLRYEDRALVMPTDSFRWAQGFQPIEDEPVAVFLDPPYREYENHSGRMRQLLQALIARLPEGSAIALESSSHVAADILPEPERWDLRRYGNTQVAIRVVDQPARRPGQESP